MNHNWKIDLKQILKITKRGNYKQVEKIDRITIHLDDNIIQFLYSYKELTCNYEEVVSKSAEFLQTEQIIKSIKQNTMDNFIAFDVGANSIKCSKWEKSIKDNLRSSAIQVRDDAGQYSSM